MRTDILAEVKQTTTPVHSEGEEEIASMSRLGQIFTAGWKQKLLTAGKLWVISVGGMGYTGNVTIITGGGNATCIDHDQPEIAIGCPVGYFLIPVEIRVGCRTDLDGDQEVSDIIAITDRAADLQVTVPTCTVETPLNLLDGAAAYPGRVWSAITTDITAPTVSEVLDYEAIEAAGASTGSRLKMHYEPDVPSILAGPCAVYIFWGGDGVTTGIARVVVACVESSWFAP